MWASGDWRAGESFVEVHVLRMKVGSKDVGTSERRFIHNDGICIVISAYYLGPQQNRFPYLLPGRCVVGAVALPLTTRSQVSLAPDHVRACP